MYKQPMVEEEASTEVEVVSMEEEWLSTVAVVDLQGAHQPLVEVLRDPPLSAVAVSYDQQGRLRARLPSGSL